MIIKIYSVRDKLVGFGGPLAFQDDKVAIRWFEAFCQEKIRNEYTKAKYYDLYHIGDFDTEKGELMGSSSHEIELVREGEQLDEPEN